MATSIEAQGQTVDEAIQIALNQLGVSRDKVEIDILHHPRRGLLGIGARRAKVRATLRESVLLDGEEFDMSGGSSLDDKPRRRRRRGGRNRGDKPETAAPQRGGREPRPEGERRADGGERRGDRRGAEGGEARGDRERGRGERGENRGEERRGEGRGENRRGGRGRGERRDERGGREGRGQQEGRAQNQEARERQESREPREGQRAESREARPDNRQDARQETRQEGREPQRGEGREGRQEQREGRNGSRRDRDRRRGERQQPAEEREGEGESFENELLSGEGGEASTGASRRQAEEPLDAAQLDAIRVRAEQLVRELLEKMGFAAEVSSSVDEAAGEAVVSVRSDSEGLLIGRRGQTLDSLEHIVNRMALRGEAYVEGRVLLDIGDYRRRRRESLEELAGRLRARAVSERRTVQVSPMSPRDRKFFALAFAGDESIEVRALGAGFYRRVIVAPAGMGAAAIAEAEAAGEHEEESAGTYSGAEAES